jgi:DNA-binding XRE family transcriptional regulator
MSPESRAWVDKRAKKILREMPLEELRAARQLTQQQLAKLLKKEES